LITLNKFEWPQYIELLALCQYVGLLAYFAGLSGVNDLIEKVKILACVCQASCFLPRCSCQAVEICKGRHACKPKPAIKFSANICLERVYQQHIIRRRSADILNRDV
jgi:hypothetical protein